MVFSLVTPLRCGVRGKLLTFPEGYVRMGCGIVCGWLQNDWASYSFP